MTRRSSSVSAPSNAVSRGTSSLNGSATHHSSSETAEALIAHCTRNLGFPDAVTRERAWPLLLGTRRNERHAEHDWRTLPVHRDEHQVHLDVERAFDYTPKELIASASDLPATAAEEKQRAEELGAHRRQLENLIVSVLRRQPNLCYFQGFHDIAQVVLLVLGPDAAPATLTRLSLIRIRDFMLSSLQPALSQLTLIRPLLQQVDQEVAQKLRHVEPHYALAAVLTLYAHDVEQYETIVRLFDVFLTQEAAFPLYLFAANIIENRHKVLKVEDDEPEVLHVILSKLFRPSHLGRGLRRALKMLEDHPPDTLMYWSSISRFSTLSTCRTMSQWAGTSNADAKILLAEHEKEVRRDEQFAAFYRRVYNYRRPLLLLAGTIAVAFLARAIGPRQIASLWSK